jgi:Fibronectin type III domain
MNFKVYVTLGFHVNFYHSWRGDTPDEAGFGTDIRVIREIIKTLNRANQAGLKARGYWDTEVYWTFQEILPKHSPDILADIRRRVDAGLDEIVLGPFNNGANHAATTDEFRASVAWAIENEWGSGLKQLFGKVAPFYRPQETMFTIGQESIFKEYGVDGLILYYAGVPFNTISSFIPRLDDEQRYNPLWFRSREDQPPLILLPCIAAGDLIEQVSLENLMLDLHRKQLRGEIRSDVIINLNEDADLETWLPSIKWMPNMGGLDEFINVVNKYPWADFTLPSEYAATHAPKGDVLVRQDLADGGYDGNYSWAEKCSSIRAWTLLEQSRLASYRADVLAKRAGMNLDSKLWDGMGSSFFQRLIGLTTTHFGMSTPIINEERQNKAYAILGKARQLAQDAERDAACDLRQPSSSLYDFELYLTPPARDVQPNAARVPVSLPIVLPAGVNGISAEDDSGRRVRASLTDREALPEGRINCRLRFEAALKPESSFRVRVQASAASPCPSLRHLHNKWLDVKFSESHGIESFTSNGEVIGTTNLLNPFVTYGNRTFRSAGYEFEDLDGETWDGLQRVRLKTKLPMRTLEGEFTSELVYTFTLFDELPYLLVDVCTRYADTPKKQVIHNLTQKLRRLMDLRWIETTPFELTPVLASESPLRVWKHNYMGITAFYDLDYGKFNPKNRNLDSFNHQVTAGWVAVSNGEQGLLIGEDAQTLSSMAFCPMRLREINGQQIVSLNPFGSYYGRQFDYSHLGGNGNGTVIMQAFSGALSPNGPSFNGETLRFSLLLAPYKGDEPPQELQDTAAAHFYSPGVIVHSALPEMNAVTIHEIEKYIESEKYRIALQSNKLPDPPNAFLANPSANAVDLVWDAPREGVVTGYEIEWKYANEGDSKLLRIDALTRWRMDGLQDGRKMKFRIRSLRGDVYSPWTGEQICAPAAVTDSSVLAMLGRIPLGTMVKMIGLGLWSKLRIR